MKTNDRRNEIINILKSSAEPVPAKYLATKFDVSRQVIVQDIAVIRASLPDIMSTNRGYVLQKASIYSREFKVRHDSDRVEEELNIMVDFGGHVISESISHRVYGRISAQLDIRSRQDVREFLARLENSKSTILGNATSGYHYHIVEASCEDRLNLIEEKLTEAGFIVPLLPWEEKASDKGIDSLYN